MENILLSLNTIPGLGPAVMLIALLMIGLDVKKLYAIATAPKDKTKKPDLRFFYILPGLFLFAFGYEILMA